MIFHSWSFSFNITTSSHFIPHAFCLHLLHRCIFHSFSSVAVCVCVRQLGKKLLNMVELHKNRNVCSPKTTINFINLWNGQKCTSKWNRTIARSLCVFHFYDLSSVQGSLLGIFSCVCVFTFGSLLVSRCINFRWRYASTQKKTTFKRTLYRMERRGRVHTHTQAATKKSSKWFHCIELVLWKLL